MCDAKVIGPVKVNDVVAVLPFAEFVLQHISMDDPRREGPARRDVYALTMSKDEFDKLLAVVGTPKGKK